MLLYLRSPTAWRFGWYKFRSSDPGRANIACLIKRKVLSKNIYITHHLTHGWAEQARLYKFLEKSVYFRTGSRQLFTWGADLSTSATSGRRVPPCHPPEVHTRARHGSPVLCLGDPGRVQSTLSLADVWIKSSSWCRSVWGEQVQLSGWLRGVDAPRRQVKIDHCSCLSICLEGALSPEQGDGKTHESAPKPPELPAQHVMGSCHWPGVMLLSRTVNCSFLGADSHPFHLFLLKQTFKDTFGVLASSATVGQPETRNGVLLQRQKRVLQFTHFSDGLLSLHLIVRWLSIWQLS